MRPPQEDSIEIRLMILYGSTLAIGRELAEVRQSLGTASYQIGDELAVRSFQVFHRRLTHSPPGQYQEVRSTDPPEPLHPSLQGFHSERLSDREPMTKQKHLRI